MTHTNTLYYATVGLSGDVHCDFVHTSAGPSFGVDNRGIFDTGKSQMLSHVEITGMKEQGITGQVS